MTYIYTKIFILFVCLLIAVPGISNKVLIADSEESIEPRILQFEIVDGLILVNATLEGINGNYIFDTGARHLTLNKDIGTGDIELLTVNGSHKGVTTNIDEFQFASIYKRNQFAWQMDLSFVEELINRPIAGIFGNDLLKDYVILIDFKKSEIELISPSQQELNIEIENYNLTTIKIEDQIGPIPIIEVKVDGQKKNLIFDTGAAISVLDESDENNLVQPNKIVALNQVHIRDVQFVSRDLSPLRDKSRQKLDGILSVTSLNTSKVIIDNRNSRVHLFWSKD